MIFEFQIQIFVDDFFKTKKTVCTRSTPLRYCRKTRTAKAESAKDETATCAPISRLRNAVAKPLESSAHWVKNGQIAQQMHNMCSSIYHGFPIQHFLGILVHYNLRGIKTGQLGIRLLISRIETFEMFFINVRSLMQ